MSEDLVIVTGAPGAGKSTVARAAAAQRSHGVHLHTDDFWHAIVAGGIPPYLPESDAQNHAVVRAVVGAAFAYADGGYDVFVDGIVGPWMLGPYRDGAAAHPEVGVHYVVLRPSRETALARAQARTAPDALVDAAPILGLWDQFADLGDLEAHAIDTSDLTAAATVARVESAVASGRFVLPA